MKLLEWGEAGEKASIDAFEVVIIQPQGPELRHTPEGRGINGADVVVIQMQVRQCLIVPEIRGLDHPQEVVT